MGSLVVTRQLLSCSMQAPSYGMHVESSSLTRDRTWTPCIGSAESYTLRHQGSLRFILCLDVHLGCFQFEAVLKLLVTFLHSSLIFSKQY